MPRVAGNLSEFFLFTIQAVAVTFLKVIDQFPGFCTKFDKYFSQSTFPHFPGHHFPHRSTTTPTLHNIIRQQSDVFCTKMLFNSNSIAFIQWGQSKWGQSKWGQSKWGQSKWGQSKSPLFSENLSFLPPPKITEKNATKFFGSEMILPFQKFSENSLNLVQVMLPKGSTFTFSVTSIWALPVRGGESKL